jgi:hypothetical protein
MLLPGPTADIVTLLLSVDCHNMQSNEPRGAEGILETRQAYDFTLDTIGQDIHSGEWQVMVLKCADVFECLSVVCCVLFLPAVAGVHVSIFALRWKTLV